MATQTEIISTAETLLEEGTRPTLAAVRAALGGGSFTTISEALKGWKAEKAKSEARADVVSVPESIQQAMSQAAITVWAEAQQHHVAQMAAEREALEQDRQRIEAERQEAMELADQVSRDLETAEARATKAETSLETERLALSNSRAATAEAEANARERAARIDALTTEVRQVRDSERQARDEAAKLAGKLEVLTSSSVPDPKLGI